MSRSRQVRKRFCNSKRKKQKTFRKNISQKSIVSEQRKQK
ncbi:Hypothetical protein LDBND_0036 [Lactobacillus delbrueckii subsp. bulgaricus ND02]|nr:Hypothetical protein LDBND_0036 [Lactobacillus delbrueckii subsp. bulgaricus ND02]